jgi:hypothetical protein
VITVSAYQAKDFVEAVCLGDFDNADALDDVKRLWGKESVGLNESVKIDLVQFNRAWWYDEAEAWGKKHKRTPMQTAHTMGIAADDPEVHQYLCPIAQITSDRDGQMLYYHGPGYWRFLNRFSIKCSWPRDFVVGFLSK